jgi:cell fate (sporulation/competence/biofilm development) regulator YlbF (YheA/YmcA/DUF963 family)
MPKKRPIEERLAEKHAEIAKLEAEQKAKVLDDALKDGRVAKEDQREFKSLKSELRHVQKAQEAAARHGNDDLVEPIAQLSENIEQKMHSLISSE